MSRLREPYEPFFSFKEFLGVDRERTSTYIIGTKYGKAFKAVVWMTGGKNPEDSKRDRNAKDRNENVEVSHSCIYLFLVFVFKGR